MKQYQLPLGGRTEQRPSVKGGAHSKRKRFHIRDCSLCKAYYADWMKQMNSGRAAMLRRLHEGYHIHGD